MRARRIATFLLAVAAGTGAWWAGTTEPDLGTALADRPTATARVGPNALFGTDSMAPVMRSPAREPRLAREAGAGAVAPAAVTVTAHGGLLDLIAHEAPLRDALAAITRASGIAFTGVDGAVERVSASLGPLPAKALIAQLLSRTSYGHAYLDPLRPGELARVVLVPGGAHASPPGRPATLATPPLARIDLPDPEAMRQQQATDAMFDACKAQACDSS